MKLNPTAGFSLVKEKNLYKKLIEIISFSKNKESSWSS